MRQDVLIVDKEFEGVPEELASACLLAANGLYHFRRLDVGGASFIEACERVGPGWPAPGMEEFGGEVGLKLHAPRILRDQLLQVEAFFRAVYAEHCGEAVCFLYFSPHNGGIWRFVAPEQEVSGGGLSWEAPGPPPNGWYNAGSFHSHGRMSAFHSGGDDDDELDWEGVHVTIGRITAPHPEYAASVVLGGTRLKVAIEDLIEPAEAVEFPAQWLGQVRRRPPPPQPLVINGQPTALGRLVGRGGGYGEQ